jgi:hypothetical protein
MSRLPPDLGCLFRCGPEVLMFARQVDISLGRRHFRVPHERGDRGDVNAVQNCSGTKGVSAAVKFDVIRQAGPGTQSLQMLADGPLAPWLSSGIHENKTLVRPLPPLDPGEEFEHAGHQRYSSWSPSGVRGLVDPLQGRAQFNVDLIPFQPTELDRPAPGEAKENQNAAERGPGGPQQGTELLVCHVPARSAFGIADAGERISRDYPEFDRPIQGPRDGRLDPAFGPVRDPGFVLSDPEHQVNGPKIFKQALAERFAEVIQDTFAFACGIRAPRGRRELQENIDDLLDGLGAIRGNGWIRRMHKSGSLNPPRQGSLSYVPLSPCMSGTSIIRQRGG